MDLLGGYDSNSSSDNDDDVAEKHSLPTLPSNKDNNDNKTKTTTNKKGKKLLKLQAVLPEHIWNQLSGGANNDSDDDDDDDDNGKEGGIEKPKSKSFSKIDASVSSKNSELSELLQALPQSKNSNSLLGRGGTILGGSEESVTTVQGSSSTNNETSTSLGAAFVTATVETVRKKKNEIRDIHQTNTVVETVQDEDDNEEEHSTPEAPPMAFVPRPSASRVVSAAPAVRKAAPTVYRAPPPPPPAASHYAATAPYYSAAATTAAPTSKSKKYSRKRQMEQLLRSGNLEAFQGDIELQGTANVYEAPTETPGTTYQAVGVRVVPTQRYVASSGTTAASTNITGKQRSKHQLNSLLASAASLESERLRNPQSTRPNTHRATAKRKYGW